MKRTALFLIAFVALFVWACRKDNQHASEVQQEAPAAAAANPNEGDDPPPDPENIAACCIAEPTNVVHDPGFFSIVPANLYTVTNTQGPCNNLRPFSHPTHNVNWFASPYTNSTGLMYNTPQVPVNSCNTLQLIAGACDNGSVSFWGNQVTGESITQKGLQLIQNHIYKIRFNARLRPGSVGTAAIAMRFSSQVPSGTTDVRNIPVGANLLFGNNSAPVSVPITTQTWECYTMPAPLFTNLFYNTLHVYPVNNLTANGSWAIIEIDNIQVY